MQELIDRTQDELDLQYLAQCVSHHRKLVGHTKKDYEKLSTVKVFYVYLFYYSILRFICMS